MHQGNKRSSNSMKRGENLEPLPTDLIIEIFSRLPAKSVDRFRSLSKLWAWELGRREFTDLFFTRSPARPLLLFAIQYAGEWSFFSLPQYKNPHESSSFEVASGFRIGFPGDLFSTVCAPVSGLIYVSSMQISKDDKAKVPVVFNPTTGQYAELTQPRRRRRRIRWMVMEWKNDSTQSFFGYDPINKQFKVLSLTMGRSLHYILTLVGTGIARWKRIKCKRHYPLCEGICINGVLYYIARRKDVRFIVCFDVRSEKFSFIREAMGISLWPNPSKLINFKGSLGGIQREWCVDDVAEKRVLKLCLWVLEDAEMQEWSNRVYTLPVLWENDDVSIVGMTTDTCEIVLLDSRSNPFYVFYFNLDTNTIRRVEIRGVEAFENHRVQAFVGHVEDLKSIWPSLYY